MGKRSAESMLSWTGVSYLRRLEVDARIDGEHDVAGRKVLLPAFDCRTARGVTHKEALVGVGRAAGRSITNKLVKSLLSITHFRSPHAVEQRSLPLADEIPHADAWLPVEIIGCSTQGLHWER
jgi:hypothetical protein